MAEIAGRVRLGEKKKGKRMIIVEAIDEQGRPVGVEKEHVVPHGKHLRVHTNDYVKEGDPLVDGPLVPHDILRISGADAVQNYLVREVQSVYRSQRVDIDDKHIEIIVAAMLRKVKVETMGDTGLLPGSVIDKFAFREVNEHCANASRSRIRANRSSRRAKSSARTPSRKSACAWIPRAGGRRLMSRRPRPRAVWCSWGSPRRRCSRIVSSRPRVSRKRRRC